MSRTNTDSDVLERVKTSHVSKRPDMYDVIMYNDDVTPMDAVVIILMEAFQKDLMSALAIMMSIHTSDKGLIGTYSMEEAYSKLEVAEKLKVELEVPSLLITVEKH